MTPKEHKGLQKSFEQMVKYLNDVIEFPYVQNNEALKARVCFLKEDTLSCHFIITSKTFKDQITNEKETE